MDLETENRIASILMKEAAELRRQAEKEGVNAYMRERNVRFRPNSRFLTATVLGVQQANRVAEVNDLWRVREKELKLNDRLKRTSKDRRNHNDSLRSTSSGHQEHNDSLRITSSVRMEHIDSLGSPSTRHREHISNSATSSKTKCSDSYSSEDGGLKDEEVERFLHSRVKRGRGGVGPRMDEPGPYLPRGGSNNKTDMPGSPNVREKEEWECRVLGPEKPSSLTSNRYIDDDVKEDSWKKAKKVKLESSKKHRERKDKHANKERKERKSKHRRRRC